MKLRKKGFTIVELVIVIAVIAVLAAVLIPTFVNLTRKANVSADTVLVKNLNTSLSSDAKEHKTMHDALEAAKANGYDIAKIQTKANDNKILWDSKNDCFVYLDTEKDELIYIPNTKVEETKEYDLWIISNEIHPKYSTYLYGYNESSVETSKGIDTSDAPTVTSVTYTNTGDAQKVVIRTNSANTTLTINAKDDIVNHHGAVGRVDIQKIDMDCYNEYGTAAYIKVTEGKVVAKAGGKIEVVFAANNDKDAVAVIKETNGTIERGLIVIEPVSTTNEARTNGIALEFSVDGETAATKTTEQLATELETREAAVEVIAVDVIETAVEKEAVEADESDFWIVCHADEFASGSGTEQDPYIIKTARQLSLLAYNVNTLKAGFASAWYKLGKDIDLSGKAWTPIGTTNGENTIYFTGHFDGNGYSISGLTNNGKTAVDLGLYRSELSSVKGLAATYGLFGFVKDAEYKNVDIKSATIDGSSHFKQSGFIAGIAEGNITMTNCSIDSNCTLNGLSKVGGLIGEYINYGTGMNNKLGVFTDCSFAGSITATDRAGAIIGAVKTNENNLYQFNQCVSTGSLTVEGYGVGLIGFKYQGSVGEKIEFPTFEYAECSIDLSKLTAPKGKGKYIGSIQHKTMLIIDSEYDNLAFGEINSIGSMIALVFNDDMYMFNGSKNDVLPAISSLSGTTYDIGQFWYDSTTTAWSSLTSYGDNMISFSGNFFVKINNSSFVIENSKIKVKGGELKLDTVSISLDEINSKFIAEGYVATLNHESNGTTLKGYIVNPSE